jgi:hypothetical protein
MTVDPHRKVVLIGGPIVLIAACFLLTMGTSKHEPRVVPRPIAVDVVSPLQTDANSQLRRACENVAQDLLASLNRDDAVLIRPPYVIAGDLPQPVLARLDREVIQPTERALNISFFDVQPTEPITILAFRNETAFREFARRVDRRQPESYYGYYLREQRRLVVNISTGAGTLAHELTHALAHFDFPKLPEWFDEGLASVFEQSEFATIGDRLTGTDNWRVHHLLRAMYDKNLRSADELVNGQSVRPHLQAIDYAHSRYLCLYLQELQLLEPYYRKLRARADSDPTGWQTLREVLQVDDAKQLDADFQRWVVRYHKSQRDRTARSDRRTLSMKPIEFPQPSTNAIANEVRRWEQERSR